MAAFGCTILISTRHIKIFQKIKKVQSWTGVKSTGTGWTNLMNKCKKYRNKSVQLTITSIIISHTHAPLQVCIIAPNYNLHCDDTDGEHKNGVTIQSSSGAWVWLIIILVIVSCTDLFLYFLYLFRNFIQLAPVLFTPVQLCTFFNFFENFLYLVSILFYCPLD